jgi:hypothetical protein
MRKSLLILTAVAACFILLVYFAFSQETSLSEQGEEGSSVFKLPFKIPFITPDTEEETNSGGSGAVTTTEGSGSEEPYVPSIYTLSIDSIPSPLDVYTEYVSNGTLSNETRPTPFSLELEENMVVCVADATGYEGIFWLLDEVGCEFARCGEFEWGCSITMDSDHNATLRQYS